MLTNDQRSFKHVSLEAILGIMSTSQPWVHGLRDGILQIRISLGNLEFLQCSSELGKKIRPYFDQQREEGTCFFMDFANFVFVLLTFPKCLFCNF